MSRLPIIAIDGPGGSGKSTVARALAATLGVEVLDTGAMYRAAALAALRSGASLDDAEALGELTRSLVLQVDGVVLLDGEDVSEAIRSPQVNAAVSVVAAHHPVRSELVARQRAWVESRGGGVVEGRDIGSVVLPDADVKVYLTASEDERARRRAAENADAGRGASLEQARHSIAQRDQIDKSRADSPLVVAGGAIEIDSTGRSATEITDEILSLLEKVRSQ